MMREINVQDRVRSLDAEITEVLDACSGDGRAEMTQAERDWVAVEDESVFFERYGFVWPRKYRELLIRMKWARDLTDEQIKILHRDGTLRREIGSVSLRPNRWLAIAGWLFFLYMSLPFAHLALTALRYHPDTLGKLLVVFAAGCVYLLMPAVIYRYWIEPWHVWWRNEREVGHPQFRPVEGDSYC